MTGHVFGTPYSDAYDVLYQDKDYQAECDLLEQIFRTYVGRPVKTVLDMGCGTGGHAIPLAMRGYQVTGLDRSKAMLEKASQKAAALPAEQRPSFILGDVRDFTLTKTFDATLLMFAVLGYQLENRDVLDTLRNVRRHLDAGGMLIFDVWYGPAVLRERPAQRLKVIPIPDGQILRAAWGELDIPKHLCAVHYRLWRLEKGQLVAETEESHVMRYFFPQELALFLECAGFTLVCLGAFPDLYRPPDETTWNVLGVAQPV